jgi:hypothetical protein
VLQGQDDPSNSKDSSTSSALFDLELSQRGGRAGDLLARLNPSVHALDSGSTHASGDPSVRLPSGLLQRIIYLSRPVMEFELDVSRGRGGGCGRSCRGGSHGLTPPTGGALSLRCAPWPDHLAAAHAPPCSNCFAALPSPSLQLLQDLRALRSTAQRGPDGQLDLAALVAALQGLGYACYLKRNNPGARSCSLGRTGVAPMDRVHAHGCLLVPFFGGDGGERGGEAAPCPD